MTGSGAESLLRQGSVARREHRLDDAKKHFTQAVEMGRASDDPALLAACLKRLAEIERDLGDTTTALAHYEEAAALARTLDDPLNLAHIIRHIADILRESGQLLPASPVYREALAIYRNHPETGTLDLANTLRGIALLHTELGETKAAIADWQEARDLYNQVWQEPGSPYRESDLAPGVLESQRQIALLMAR